jgi:predicted PurR-regulated permease PerM
MGNPATREGQRTTNYLLGFFAIVVGGGVLYLAQSVILPLILAIFLTVVIGPALKVLSHKLPIWLSLVIVLLGLAILLVGGTLLFVSTSYQVADRAPGYVDRFEGKFQTVIDHARARGIELSWDQIGLEKGAGFVLKFLGAGLESVVSILGQMAIVLFLTIFLALEATQFQKKVRIGFKEETREKIHLSAAAIIDQIQSYAMTKTFLSFLTGMGTYLICWGFGVDFPFFWGTLAFLLNYIPNVGSIISLVPPVLLSLLLSDGYGKPAGLLLSLIIVQNLIGNVLEPKLLSKSMKISALVVFLSMIFWGWLWGIVGVVLAVPLTVAVKIACGHVEMLRPFSILLGGDPIPVREKK